MDPLPLVVCGAAAALYALGRRGRTRTWREVSFYSGVVLTFAAAELSKTVAVTVNGDDDIESDETFSGQLSHPSAAAVIDVITGKHVSGANLEETVTKTNVEAAQEIARQLRLRDIGGMIIIDFIDMLLERNKDKVIQTLQTAMAEDKTRSQVFDQISPLGLVEVTRKRVSAGLLESFSHTCPECEGRGIIIDHKI